MSASPEHDVEDTDSDRDLLTFEGRARRGLSEVVLRRTLPTADSDCGRRLEEILGRRIDFHCSATAVTVPWLELTNRYQKALDDYTISLAASVTALRTGSVSEMVDTFRHESTCANTLAIEKRQAISAIMLLARYLQTSISTTE